MGFGEMAAMLYLNNKAERENQNAAELRSNYNDLVHRFNDLLDKHNALKEKELWYCDQVNSRAATVRKYMDLSVELSQERLALVDEVAGITDKMAQKDKYIEYVAEYQERQKAYNKQQNAIIASKQETIDNLISQNKQQNAVITSKQETIDTLTSENNYLENNLEQKSLELAQRVYVGETIRRGMHHVPVEYRIKAAAESFVRHPDVSQASLNTKMSEKMKADVEMFLGLALFPEAGEKRAEVGVLYEQAKAVVREDVAASDKVFQELLEIRDARVKEAVARGEDSSSVPNIWVIQAELDQKKEAEAKASTSDREAEDEEEYFSPGM